MKIKKRKPKIANLEEVADQFGREYEALSEKAKVANDQKALTAINIKDLARESGIVEGARCVVRGNEYEVGYTTCKPTRSVNWGAFFKKYPKWQAKLMRPQVDEKLVEAALTEGTLSRKLIEKYIVQNGEPQERVFVGKIREQTENPE